MRNDLSMRKRETTIFCDEVFDDFFSTTVFDGCVR